jgi:hypothetical protein
MNTRFNTAIISVCSFGMFWLAYRVLEAGAFSVKGVYSDVSDHRIATAVGFIAFGLFFLGDAVYLEIKSRRRSKQKSKDQKRS